MNAVLFTRYGSPEGLVPGELPQPNPGERDVLVRVHAATVTAGDAEMRRLDLPLRLRIPIRLYLGLVRPRRVQVLGMEFAGTVENAGASVTRFRSGDEVFGTTGFRFGSYAEYAVIPRDAAVARKPPGVSFEDAATLPTGGLEALALVRRAEMQNGDRVLVYGGSGSIGTFAIQLAHNAGAAVTAVGNPSSLDLMRSLGAERVIDYTTTDFATEATTYDVIVDAIGKCPFARAMRRLAPDGRYVSANPRMRDMIAGSWISLTSRRRVIFGTVEQKDADLEYLASLVADGRLRVVIDRRYPLDQVADAHRYVDAGHKTGNVVITVI